MTVFNDAGHYLRTQHEWDKWAKEVPYIAWPAHWLVTAVPPFAGAIIRYRIKLRRMKDFISVYLDCYDKLGFYGSPYWEIYPDENGDCHRCGINEVDELLEEIEKALERKRRMK